MSDRVPRDLALHGALSANVVGFGRLLRDRGVPVGPGETALALAALGCVDVGDEDQFYLALRATLAKSAKEQQVFDDCFASYWHVWDRATQLNRPTPDPERPIPQTERTQPVQLTLRDWLRQGDDDGPDEEETAGYSPMEVVTRRNFAGLRPDELGQVGRVVEELARALARRLSRRYRELGGRRRLDLRRTLRGNLRRGGELVDLAYRARKRQRLSLVVLCDVSRSMDLYSRFLLQFLFAFAGAYRRLEVFGFSTALRHLTPTLRDRDWGRVLAGLAQRMPEWSGGTRIGQSLAEFADRWGEPLVGRRTAVIILSDGWDTGDAAVLSAALARIRRRAFAVLWLNPLMGSPGYRPETEGMRTALPHIDLLAPAHNAAALREVARRLHRLERCTAARRPYAAAAQREEARRAQAASEAATPAAGPDPFATLRRLAQERGDG